MKFWTEEMGVKFVDSETGEELKLDDSEDDGAQQD